MSAKYPLIEINLTAVEQNARVLSELCGKHGISLAGVIKFSDGSVPVAKAYAAGGCRQIAVSRSKHLAALREAMPDTELLLTRAPGPSDVEETAKYADLTLYTSEDGLRDLNEKAAALGTKPGVLLMFDVGDLREGLDNVDDLCRLAKVVENELPNVRLRGIGTNLACLNGVLPTPENLTCLSDAAEAVEKTIGRRLDWISGGSSIDLLLLKDGICRIPPRINHLRIGGVIANPRNIRINRGLSFPGLREDSAVIRAEVIEVEEKDSKPHGESTLNWSGTHVEQVDRGRRLRAILALGSQDIGDVRTFAPQDEGVEVIGCSSDHTIVDVTDCPTPPRYGDVLSFRTGYSPLLYSFTGSHVHVVYTKD